MGGPDRKFVWKEGAKRGAPGWGSMTYYSSGVFNPLGNHPIAWSWDSKNLQVTGGTEPSTQNHFHRHKHKNSDVDGQKRWDLKNWKGISRRPTFMVFQGGKKLVLSNSLWTNGCGATFNCAKQRCKRFTMSRQWQAGMRMNYSAGCSHGDIQWTRLFLSRQFLTLNCVRKSLIQN